MNSSSPSSFPFAAAATASAVSYKSVDEFRAEIQTALKSCKDDKAKAEYLANVYMDFRKHQNLNVTVSAAAYPLGDLARALLVYSQSDTPNLSDDFPESIHSGSAVPLIKHTKLGIIFINAPKECGKVDTSIEFFTKNAHVGAMFAAFGKEAVAFLKQSAISNEMYIWSRDQINKELGSKTNNIQEQAKFLFRFYVDYCQNQARGPIPSMSVLPLGNLAQALKVYSEGQNLRSAVEEYEQNATGYSSTATTVNEIFKDTINTDGKVAKSVQYFQEGPDKNGVLAAFGTEATDFVKKKITNLV